MRAQGHVADAFNVIDAFGRVELVPARHQNGQAAINRPASAQGIAHADVEQVVVVFDLIVIQLALGLLVGTNEVPRRRLIAISEGQLKVRQVRLAVARRFTS